jgi:hypothetical protein
VTVNDILYFIFRFSIDNNGLVWGKSLARHRVSIGRLKEGDMEYWVNVHGGR